MRGRKRNLVFLVAGLAVVLDQGSKWLVQGSMSLYESVPVITGLFNLSYIRNTGGAFGTLAGRAAAARAPRPKPPPGNAWAARPIPVPTYEPARRAA